MGSGVLDDPVEDVVGGHRQDAGADFLEGQLDGVALGDARPGDDRDDRLDAALAELEGQDDPIELEEDPRLVDLRRELVGEMGDQVLGQPGVDFLVGEDGLPVRLVADIVAELKALRHELLGLARAAVRATGGPCHDNRMADRSATARRRPGSRPASPGQTPTHSSLLVVLCMGHPDPGIERDAGSETTIARGKEWESPLAGPEVETWSNRYMKHTTASLIGQPGLGSRLDRDCRRTRDGSRARGFARRPHGIRSLAGIASRAGDCLSAAGASSDRSQRSRRKGSPGPCPHVWCRC